MFFTKSYFVQTSRECDALVVTSEIRWALRESNIQSGLIVLSLPKGGGGWVLLEPKEVAKTKSNLPDALLQPQLTLPVHKGDFLFDPKREITLFDFTDSGKRREFTVNIIGEGGEEKKGPQAPQRRAT